MKEISFAKYCCGGNDFIIVDCRKIPLPENLATFVTRICDRRYGAGADGVIFLLEENNYPFKIQLFNSDGSGAEVSYNGSRCVALYAEDHGLGSKDFTFLSDAGEIHVCIENDVVTLDVPPPTIIELDLARELETSFKTDFVHAGVPYLVFTTFDLTNNQIDLDAPTFKTHPRFPKGTNVAVMKPEESNCVSSRFFERGVEEETPSSGTGCVAAAIVANQTLEMTAPITVLTAGGEFLINFARDKDEYCNISTAGSVAFAFEGVFRL